MRLGACHYPEHGAKASYVDDARRMVAMRPTIVRSGGIGWSRVEPKADRDQRFGGQVPPPLGVAAWRIARDR